MLCCFMCLKTIHVEFNDEFNFSQTTQIYVQLGCLGELAASLPMHITLGQIQDH